MSRGWMPLYVADYLADTMRLSTVEHGAFLLLLMHRWDKGELPTEDLKLAKICRIPLTEWLEIKETIADLFERERWGLTPADAAVRGRFHARRSGISSAVRKEIFQRDGGTCQYCGNTAGPFEIDHVIPWSRGGKHSADNFALACKPCNRDKGALTPDEWQQ